MEAADPLIINKIALSGKDRAIDLTFGAATD
jgi:hypothetical protein